MAAEMSSLGVAAAAFLATIAAVVSSIERKRRTPTAPDAYDISTNGKSMGTTYGSTYSSMLSLEGDDDMSMASGEPAYIPGEYMPGRCPDEVVLYYCKSTLDNEEYQEVPKVVDAKDKGTPDEWIPRHHSLVRLTGRHPFNCEAPLKKLFDKGFITPTSLHYVRSHGAAPLLKWEDHTVYLGGMMPKCIQLKMKDIVALPTHSLPVTLVCCGNRRKEQNMIKQTKGFNWGAAGVSTGVWTGCRLSTLLRLAGVTNINAYPPGMHIRFASESELGGDKLPSGVYGTSVTLEKALDDSQDIIVAYMYNGKLLTPDHGFPVRVIVPGYIGGRMIKWLTNIDLQDNISQDYYHFFDNRVLPSHVDAELAMSEGWWYKPEYICNDLSINSAIARPDHDEEVQAVAGQSYLCQGYAYNGRGNRITKVELSLDSGVVWRLATLKIYERPSRTGKHWCWLFWEVELSHEELVHADEIVLRAWDEGHAVQPDKPTWNLMGMLNNPWFRVKIHKVGGDEAGGAGDLPRLRFEHPTLAGNQNGGWMMRLKEHPSLITPGIHNDHATGAGAMVAATAVVKKEEEVRPTAAFDPSAPSFTMEEVARHSDAASSWIVVNERVYDATPFLKGHPGGKESILLNAGTECSEEFDAIHSKKAWKMLEDYYIGQLRPEGVDVSASLPASAPAPAPAPALAEASGPLIALDPKKKIPFALAKRVQLSPDSLLLRFNLQSSQHILGLPVGKHMFFSAKIDGKMVMRAYTPTSSDFDIGVFDLVIKVYPPVLPNFPQGGLMSQHLGSLKVGDTIDVKGPLGHVNYLGKGVMMLGDDRHEVKKFAMLCGGTGITPIYQVLAAVLRDPNDDTELHLIFANRTEVDVLLKDDLDMLAKGHPARLKIHYILSQTTEPEKWLADNGSLPTRSVGLVGKELVAEKIPPGGTGTGCYALLCGPPPFLSMACVPALEAIGYTKDTMVFF